MHILIRTIFSEPWVQSGLHYGRFGPLDQGAYNFFYQSRRVHVYVYSVVINQA